MVKYIEIGQILCILAEKGVMINSNWLELCVLLCEELTRKEAGVVALVTLLIHLLLTLTRLPESATPAHFVEVCSVAAVTVAVTSVNPLAETDLRALGRCGRRTPMRQLTVAALL